MFKKIVLFLSLLSSFIVSVGGCYSHREINRVSIVLGAGIDWIKDGRIRLTIQIANPSSFGVGGESGGTGGKSNTALVLSAEGKTVGDAIRDLEMQVPREIFWGHCLVLVFGEEMAKHGTRLAQNFFERNRQPRETMRIFVAQGEAKDFFQAKTNLEKTTAQSATFIVKKRYSVQLKDFAQILTNKGIQPVIPRVIVKKNGEAAEGSDQERGSSGNKSVVVSGMAVFKEDKLIGWLDDRESQGLIWLKTTAPKEREIISVPSPGEPDKEVSIKILKGKTEIKPIPDGDSPRFNVAVNIVGDMIEQQGMEDLVKPEKIKALEKNLSEAVKEEADTVLKKAQLEYGLDIFGFGDVFHEKHKKEWTLLQEQWDEVFSRSDVNIVVDAHIRETGLLSKRASVP